LIFGDFDFWRFWVSSQPGALDFCCFCVGMRGVFQDWKYDEMNAMHVLARLSAWSVLGCCFGLVFGVFGFWFFVLLIF
jgi:hypothetical protein